MKMRNEKGFAMLVVLMFMLTTVYGLTSLVRLGGSQARTVRLGVESIKSFYLAEAAGERAKIILKANYEGTAIGQSGNTAFGDGQYFYDIDNSGDGDIYKRIITGVGAFPSVAAPLYSRAVEIIVRKPPDIPVDFWEYAIYGAEDVRANGNTYDVVGDIIAGDDITHSQDRVTGTETEDPSISPLTMLDFATLKAIAQSQVYDGHDNYYTADEIGDVPFPTDFYFTDPTVLDPAGTPNVVFVEGNLVLNGNWATIGGFILVVGDILTDPDSDGADSTINGNGTIDGVVYTLGSMTTNGGAGGINVLGGVFAAENVTMNGNTNITYNDDYMDSIDALGLAPGMTVLSWSEIESPL